jgi:hypothetical protein
MTPPEPFCFGKPGSTAVQAALDCAARIEEQFPPPSPNQTLPAILAKFAARVKRGEWLGVN